VIVRVSGGVGSIAPALSLTIHDPPGPLLPPHRRRRRTRAHLTRRLLRRHGLLRWETQKNGLAIQEVLEKAIEKITGEAVALEGSGRTDAGVHALGQVRTFRLKHRIPAGKLSSR